MSVVNGKENKSQKSILGKIGLLALVVYFCFVMVDMNVAIAEKKDELVLQEQKLEEQRMINKDTQRQLELSNDEKEVERKAREIGYIKDNEIIYKDSSGN